MSVDSKIVFIPSKEFVKQDHCQQLNTQWEECNPGEVFDIKTDDILVDMLDGMRLFVVDVPGINEAQSGSLYMRYVEKAWDRLDYILVVMDA